MIKQPMKYIMIVTTFEKEEDASKMAVSLLSEKLVACCQIEKVNTFYWWNGKIENCIEYKLISKTIDKNYQEIEAYIKQNHSYEIPEIISSPISGSAEYLSWLEEQIK